MIYGIGIDLIDFSQININNDALLKKVLTDVEYQTLCSLKLEQKKIDFFAGRFAAKEAFVKALGTGFRGIDFKSIQIINDEFGKPSINLLKQKELVSNKIINLSISHSKTAATAIVTIEAIE